MLNTKLPNILDPGPCLTKDQIKCYINQNCDTFVERLVEHHITSCELCSNALDAYQSEPSLLDLASQLPLIAKAKQPKLIPFSKIWLGVAASLSIILTIVFLVNQYRNSNLGPKLSANFHHFMMMDDGFAMRGENSKQSRSMDNLPSAIVNAYNSRDFESALKLLDEIEEKTPRASNILFWKGITLYESGQTEKSIQYFTDVRINANQYFDEASWYLVLACTKVADWTCARNTIADILHSHTSPFKKKASELLEKIVNQQ